jgi:PGDYG protein
MKTFDTFELVDGMQGCIKRPIIVHAMRMDEEFRVNTLEGNYKQGKAGDYLMRGVDGELYICDGAIFEKTYDFVSV